MPLDKPPLPTASPGRPITAQGWNAIVDALGRLYDAVAAIGSGTLEVTVSFSGKPVRQAVVTATPAGGGNPVVAVPPAGSRASYVLAGVSEGQWQLVVQATGYGDVVLDTAVPSPGPVVVSLTPIGPTVPDMFGQPLQTAFAALTTAGLGVGLIVDTLGQEVARTPIPTPALG
jgi:hypothetical protein